MFFNKNGFKIVFWIQKALLGFQAISLVLEYEESHDTSSTLLFLKKNNG
jgi:hypothetical protein